tara:strand:+ start:313 stop:687 length:375 start_codon:yes stop_codon:yes gene_type:complete
MKDISCIRNEADIEQILHCKQTVTELGDSFELLSNALSLAGNNVRLKILFLISQEKELCVCDLSDILEMNVSAISQHLRKLKDRNIVLTERKAQTIFYSLAPAYETILSPFFKLIKNNQILETL